MRTSIALPAYRAIPKHFDPKVLEGRLIALDKEMNGREQLILEGRDRSSDIKAEIVMVNGVVYLEEGPDGVKGRCYLGIIQVRAKNEQGQIVPFAHKGDGGKLVTSADGKIYGIVIAGGKDDGGPVTALAPAHHFINPPEEHIRESLKGKFDAAILEGRKIKKNLAEVLDPYTTGYYVFLEGRPERPLPLQSRRGHTCTIDGKEFTDAYRGILFSDSTDSSPAGLEQAIKDDLFCAPTDVGKLVLFRGKNMAISRKFNNPNPAVVGIIANVNTYHVSDGPRHQRWYQKVDICSAYDVTIP